MTDEQEAARMAAELSQGYGAWHMKNYAFRAWRKQRAASR